MTIMLGIMASANSSGGIGSFESIATVTATGGETSLGFTSIPQTYKHLQIRCLVKTSTTAGTEGSIRFAPFGGGLYNHWTIGANAGGIASSPSFLQSVAIDSGTGRTDMYGVAIIDISDYSSSVKVHVAKYFSGNTSNGQYSYSGVSTGSMQDGSTPPIDYVTFTSSGFAAGTTFALYGIKGQ